MWRDEYERILRSDQHGFQSVVDFKAQHLPQSIFKFRAPTPRNLQTIRDGKVWMSAPRDFNDLYDSGATAENSLCFDLFFRRELRRLVSECGLMTWLTGTDID